ncbi:hypothetical protein BKA62DRAFT_695150 [Auriculariales sp. MPI-PUGE-AT-0066]|nr:hypothetical protein BKA62DRAFT_695150 [Auriculariales sp. MPI-PUGE-AT-0066]
MLSWFGIPTVAVPASIQSRFLSFALKRSIGHLVKPGQLDPQQIEAQLGNGFIEVKDIQLDEDAINAFLVDSPVRLVSGSLGTVTARVPWPNILSATFALSLGGIRLKFTSAPPQRHPDHARNVTESVVLVAEEFVHDELTQEENNELRRSVILDHPKDVSEDDHLFHPPGSLDPFRKDLELDDVQDVDATIEGVSVLASVVERILARFTFNATDIQVSLVQPNLAELILSLDTVSFGANAAQDSERADDTRTHTLRVSGLAVSLRDLAPKPTHLERSQVSLAASTSTLSRQSSLSASVASTAHDDAATLQLSTSGHEDASALGLTYEPDSQTPTRSPVASPFYDEDSDVDEAVMMAMSQSIVTLPVAHQRLDSQSTVSAMSVYHSVSGSVSGDQDDSDDDSDDVFHDTNDQSSRLTSNSQYLTPQSPVALEGSQAIEPVRLYDGMPGTFTASPVIETRRPPASGPSATSPPPVNAPPIIIPITQPASSEPLSQSPQTPPGQVLLSMAHDAVVVTITSSRATGMSYFAVDVRVGTVAVAINSPQARLLSQILAALPQVTGSTARTANDSSQSNTMPTIDLRAQMRAIVIIVDLNSLPHRWRDTFYAHPLSTVPSTSHLRVHIDALEGTLRVGGMATRTPGATAIQPKFTLADLSVFHHDGRDGYMPLLVTDPHLVTQYTSASVFPTIDVANWTATTAATPHPRLAQWRTRAPVNSAKSASRPAVAITMKDAFKSVSVDIDLLPVRIFVDLRMVESLRVFISALDFGDSRPKEEGEEDDDTPPATPRASDHRRVLYDLDAQHQQAVKDQQQQQQQQLDPGVSIRCPCVRVELRVPTTRSGTLVTDIHDIAVATDEKAKERQQGVTFADGVGGVIASGPGAKKIAAKVKLGRILLAYGGVGDTRATSFISIQGSPVGTVVVRSNSLDVALPALHGLLSKPLLDGLQTWADDLAQWSERALGSPTASATSSAAGSAVLGSRYFEHHAESLASSTSASGMMPERSGMVVRVVLDEANVQMFVPRAASGGAIRPFIIRVSELDLLLEPKPEGRNETLITISLLDISVTDTLTSGESLQLLGLTNERTFSSPTNPIVKVRFASSTDPGTRAKEARIRVTLYGFTFILSSDFDWATDLAAFVKNPPGTFEVVVPTERTRVNVKIIDGSVHIITADHQGGIALALTEMELATELIGDSPDLSLHVSVGEMALLAVDDRTADVPDELREEGHQSGQDTWRSRGYALLLEISDLTSQILKQTRSPKIGVEVHSIKLSLHACADTLVAVGGFAAAFGKAVSPPNDTMDVEPPPRAAMVHSFHKKLQRGDDLLASVDNDAFRKLPAVGSAPDLITDDLPTNLNYIDLSYGSAAGLVALSEDGEDDEDGSYVVKQPAPSTASGLVSSYGGETIRMLVPGGINIIDDFFDNIPPELEDGMPGDQEVRVRVSNCDVTVLLYDGYDWAGTRKAIEDEMRRIRRRLEKIRQLLANGQMPDETVEETSAVLFNSVHIGLRESPDELDPQTLLVAIDEELGDGDDTQSVSSWQSFTPASGEPSSSRRRGTSGTPQQRRQRRLRRSAKPLIEVRLATVSLDFDQFVPDCTVASRIQCAVRELEILDHIKTSTWRKFLTSKRTDSHGNVRETGSNMARVELVMVRPVPGHPSEEARLKAKVLPLRLHVDQDALDFLKKFGAFRDPRTAPEPPPTSGSNSNDVFFQHVEVFPVDLKLDYKPKRVDFQALREGKTIELMNFFHFDGAEMTLRHITLSGLTGWPRLGDTLNDLWTPDVKANQLADVISGVAPIRSLVNVGSGVADLVLLPIAHYKKDKRLLRGVQRGATSFMRSTAMEMFSLGARLATGTQVILEQAEGILGRVPGVEGGIPTLEVAATGTSPDSKSGLATDGELELESKYATQPGNVREGVKGAYKSLRTNLNSAAQTILAVPMEVHENAGDGALHTVVRAVPIAVLKPMIGASEAVSKTLFGLRNSLDPNVMQENEAKYKRRER